MVKKNWKIPWKTAHIHATNSKKNTNAILITHPLLLELELYHVNLKKNIYF